MAAAVIACTFKPGTDEKIFEAADRDELLNAPAGGWLDEISQAAFSLLNVEPKSAEKN